VAVFSQTLLGHPKSGGRKGNTKGWGQKSLFLRWDRKKINSEKWWESNFFSLGEGPKIRSFKKEHRFLKNWGLAGAAVFFIAGRLYAFKFKNSGGGVCNFTSLTHQPPTFFRNFISGKGGQNWKDKGVWGGLGVGSLGEKKQNKNGARWAGQKTPGAHTFAGWGRWFFKTAGRIKGKSGGGRREWKGWAGGGKPLAVPFGSTWGGRNKEPWKESKNEGRATNGGGRGGCGGIGGMGTGPVRS